MPSLLVATDFSATGNHAVHYACRMAADLRYEVVVLHSYVIPVAFSDTPMPLIPVQEMQNMSQGYMDELLTELHRGYPDLRIGSRLVYGDILDSLKEEAGTSAPGMVVLGNNGSGDSDLWMGSTAVSLLRHLNTPVLAVPATAAYDGVRNICLACDYKDIDDRMPVTPLLQLLDATGARLHVLHVDKEGAAGNMRYEDTALPQLLDGCTPEYHYATASGSIDEAITRFAEGQQMDWLAVIPHHHGFWEGLFHRSHTKAMARMSHIPVLAIHQPDAGQ